MKKLLIALILFIPAFIWADGRPEGARDGAPMLLFSPLAGYNRNELDRPGAGPGQSAALLKDGAPIYGAYAMLIHPRIVVNDFLFYTEPDDADVWGNLFYLNLYGEADKSVTWNVGLGHLYHKIEPRNTEITVKVPMVKVGPYFRIKPWHLSLNPNIGYAWERIETPRGTLDNDSLLYSLNLDWQWRMLMASAKYSYQKSREHIGNYHSMRVSLSMALGANWGVTTRVDYMKLFVTEDLSVMAGPFIIF